MSAARTRLIRAAFTTLDRLGANRALSGRTRGLGLILTLHHVRSFDGRAFAPNRLLEVEPDFLDLALGRASALGFDFVTLGDALERMRAGRSDRPFLHVTFDDGYRDVRDNALPVLRRHGAPATLYVASGFADGTAEIWWLALEAALARASSVRIDLGSGEATIPCATAAEKQAAWSKIYWALRAGPEARLRAETRRLALEQGVDLLSFARDLCMRWDELRALAEDPLVEIGAHTVSHPMLAKHPDAVARSEMAGSRDAIARELGRAPVHFAYPVGDLSAAGPRDYAMASELGFESAVTTMPSHLDASHAATPTALPRVSLNGHFQTRAAVDALLSGAPFALINAARRIAGRA
jgi:peptidoglycan/xylan/chitin deacetylase (PgdA/CDA1 family)